MHFVTNCISSLDYVNYTFIYIYIYTRHNGGTGNGAATRAGYHARKAAAVLRASRPRPLEAALPGVVATRFLVVCSYLAVMQSATIPSSDLYYYETLCSYLAAMQSATIPSSDLYYYDTRQARKIRGVVV